MVGVREGACYNWDSEKVDEKDNEIGGEIDLEEDTL